MKRDYKFSSILLINLIVILTISLLVGVFQDLIFKSNLFALVYTLLVSVFKFAFDFAISGGLIRDREGSVGAYLNQVNYLNMRILTVAFLLTVLTSVVSFLFNYSGGVGIFTALANPLNDSVFQLGALLLPLFIIILQLCLEVLLSYTTFYLTDTYDIDEPIFVSIKNIFLIGKRLFKGTFIINLKYIFLPIIVIFLVAFWLISFSALDSLIVFSLFVGLGAVFLLISDVIRKARISDLYLDLKELE